MPAKKKSEPEVFATLHLSNGRSQRLRLTGAIAADPVAGLSQLLTSPFIQTERGFVNTSQIVLAELDGE